MKKRANFIATAAVAAASELAIEGRAGEVRRRIISSCALAPQIVATPDAGPDDTHWHFCISIDQEEIGDCLDHLESLGGAVPADEKGEPAEVLGVGIVVGADQKVMHYYLVCWMGMEEGVFVHHALDESSGRK